MSKTLAAITGVNGYVPDYVLTNQELETMVDTSDEWITTRTGIKERRILKGEAQGTSIMTIEAVRGLLEKTNTDPKDIDVVICATVTPDMVFPDTANITAYALGMENAFCFDLGAACSGFIFALTTGAMFIQSGVYKKVVVVGGDKMSSITDYTDRTTCVLFGDAAGAVLLEPDESGNGIIDSKHFGDGSGQENLRMKGGGSKFPASHETVDAGDHFIWQNGKAVFKKAVPGMANAVTEVMKRNNLSANDISWLVPHQANRRIIETVAKMAEFPIEKVMINIQKYGNTTAATIPLCLWDWENQLNKGDNLILTAFGGGYTFGAVYVKWAY